MMKLVERSRRFDGEGSRSGVFVTVLGRFSFK